MTGRVLCSSSPPAGRSYHLRNTCKAAAVDRSGYEWLAPAEVVAVGGTENQQLFPR